MTAMRRPLQERCEVSRKRSTRIARNMVDRIIATHARKKRSALKIRARGDSPTRPPFHGGARGVSRRTWWHDARVCVYITGMKQTNKQILTAIAYRLRVTCGVVRRRHSKPLHLLPTLSCSCIFSFYLLPRIRWQTQRRIARPKRRTINHSRCKNTQSNDARDANESGTFARCHSRAHSPFADVKLRNVTVRSATPRPGVIVIHMRQCGVGVRAVTGEGGMGRQASERERKRKRKRATHGIEKRELCLVYIDMYIYWQCERYVCRENQEWKTEREKQQKDEGRKITMKRRGGKIWCHKEWQREWWRGEKDKR